MAADVESWPAHKAASRARQAQIAWLMNESAYPLTGSQIGRACGVDRSTASYLLNRMLDAGLVTCELTGRPCGPKVWRLTAHGQRLLGADKPGTDVLPPDAPRFYSVGLLSAALGMPLLPPQPAAVTVRHLCK